MSLPPDARARMRRREMAPSSHARDASRGASSASEEERDRKRPRDASECGESERTPRVSVLMPCRNAQPWLSAAVRSVLAQRDVALELVVGDDGSTDGSREWLLALERAMAARDGLGGRAGSLESAAAASETTGDASAMRTYAVEEVASAASELCTLRVIAIERDEGVSPSGQGLALNTCFEASRGTFVGEMESDDLRPPRAFAELVDALEANPTWDCATSQIELCGWDREGMKRFERWQNDLLEPEALASGRFLEIPALRATALFRREKLNELRIKCGDGAIYRDLWLKDGVVLDFAAAPSGAPVAESLPHRWWPVDSDFWNRWFHHGFTAGKVPKVLYHWRQYEAQSTRTHSRCSLEQLRRCKAYYFTLGALAGLFSPAPVRKIALYGVGETLNAWHEALEREISHQSAHVPTSDRVVVVPLEHQPGFARWTTPDATDDVIHAFVFGMEPARAKIRRAINTSFVKLPTDVRERFHVVFVA